MRDILINFIKNDFKGTSISDLINNLYKNNFNLLRDIVNNYESYENTLFKAFPSVSKLNFMEEYEMLQRGLNKNVKTEDIEIVERPFVFNAVEVDVAPSESSDAEESDDGFYKDLMEQQQTEIDVIEAKIQKKKEAIEKTKIKKKKQAKKIQNQKKQEAQKTEERKYEEQRKQEENRMIEIKKAEEVKKNKSTRENFTDETAKKKRHYCKNPESTTTHSELHEFSSFEKRNHEYFDEDKEIEKLEKEAKLKVEHETVRHKSEEQAKKSAKYKSIGNEGIDFSGKGKHLAYEKETKTKTEIYNKSKTENTTFKNVLSNNINRYKTNTVDTIKSDNDSSDRLIFMYNEKNENFIKNLGRSFSSYSPDGIVANIEKKDEVHVMELSNIKLNRKCNKTVVKNNVAILNPSSTAKRYIDNTKAGKSMITPAGQALIKKKKCELPTKNMLKNPIAFQKIDDKYAKYSSKTSGVTSEKRTTVNKSSSLIKNAAKRLGLDTKDTGGQTLSAMYIAALSTAESGDNDTIRSAHKAVRVITTLTAIPGATKAIGHIQNERIKSVKRTGHAFKNAGMYIKGWDIDKIKFEIDQLEKTLAPLSLDQHNKLKNLKNQRDKWEGKKYVAKNIKTIRNQIASYGSKYAKFDIKKLQKEIDKLKKLQSAKSLNKVQQKLLGDLTQLLELKNQEQNLIKNMGSLSKLKNFCSQVIINKLYESEDISAIDGFLKTYCIGRSRYFRGTIKASCKAARSVTKIAYRSISLSTGKVIRATGLNKIKAVKQLKSVKDTLEKSIHGGAYNATKNIIKHAPQIIKTSTKTVKKATKAVTKVKISPLKRGAQKISQMLTTSIQKFKLAIQSISTGVTTIQAAIAGSGTILPIIAIIFIVILIGGMFSGIIFDDTDNVKKYVEYIGTKVKNFQDEIESEVAGDWHSVSYEFPLKDTYDNSKEILSMTSVYISQDWPSFINFSSNYKIKRYIDNLFDKSHWIDKTITYHEYEVDNYCNCDGFCNGGHGTHTEYCKGDLVITVYCIGADEISDPNLTNFHWLDPMFAIDDIGSSGTIEESELIADDFTIKYYCGDTYNHECNNGINFGIGSTGKVLTANKSIAVDPTLIPIGTHVMINGKEYIAEDDKGGTIAGHEIYIYVGSHTEVIAKGSQLNQKVYWLRDVAATKDFEGWTNNNKEWAWNIFRQNWVEIYGIGIGGGTFISSPILEEELETIIDKIKANFPALTSQREALIRNGLQLVGRVPYFWGGGHHSALSPDVDPAWGTEYRIISAAGYSGQPLGSSWPYGLDCSGFTRWVILATTGTDSMWAGAIGQRVSMGSLPISSSELLPGDFANTSNDGHVGIYLYTDTDGKMVFLHCSPSVDGVGINKPGYFTQFYRPRALL